MRSDEELMSAYVEGDSSAFRELFGRYGPLLHRVMRRRMSDEAEVDDLVQQTFLQLHRARHDFRPDAKLRPWLFTIAFNLQREHYRRRKRKPEHPAENGASERVATPGLQERVDVARDLRRGLEKLPREQREVIELHWFEGLSFAEVALVAEASESAVKVRAHRGYLALRAILRNGNGDSPVSQDKPSEET